MKSRILFDCERLKYANTGLYTFCEHLGKALQLNAAEDQQIEYYLPENKLGLFGKDVRYHIQKSWHKIFVPNSNSYDVWHSSNQVSPYRPTSRKVKILLTIHDLNFLIEKHGRPGKIKKNLRLIQEKIDRSGAIVCISNFVANQVREHLDMADKQLLTVYNGCTVDEYPGFCKPVYKPVKPFLFSIGTVLPKKNFHVLPALLCRNDLELIIAGNLNSDEYLSKILEEAKRHGVLSRVKIIGGITNQERYWYYKNCEAFVFPSVAEGFGLPVIEAMHYGKPVFLSKHTSLPEIGSDAAYYFENFDAQHMQATLEDGLQDFSLGSMEIRTRSRAAQFTWDQTAKSYLNLYRTVR
jgi:glycosyltransferase involved in cell wall biosynthesis